MENIAELVNFATEVEHTAPNQPESSSQPGPDLSSEEGAERYDLLFSEKLFHVRTTDKLFQGSEWDAAATVFGTVDVGDGYGDKRR